MFIFERKKDRSITDRDTLEKQQKNVKTEIKSVKNIANEIKDSLEIPFSVWMSGNNSKTEDCKNISKPECENLGEDIINGMKSIKLSELKYEEKSKKITASQSRREIKNLLKKST